MNARYKRSDCSRFPSELRFGFKLMAEAKDWSQFLKLCEAQQVILEEGVRVLTIPPEKLGLFLQLTRGMVSMLDLHGRTPEGQRIELKEYVRRYGPTTPGISG